MSDQVVTVLIGVMVGLAIHKIVASPALGTVSDTLLGITGAFAGRCVLEAFWGFHSQHASYYLFVALGAAAFPWAANIVGDRIRLQASDVRHRERGADLGGKTKDD